MRPMPGALRLDAAGVGGDPFLTVPLPSRPSRKSLWALAAVVLLGHLVLLQTLPDAIAPPDRFETRSFTTRTIVVAPPAAKPEEAAPAAAAPPAPAAAPRPKPRAARKPRPATPQPESASPAPNPAGLQADAPVDPTRADSDIASAASAPAPASSASAPEATQQAQLPQPAASSAAAEQAPAAPPTQTTGAPLALAIPGSTRLKYDMSGESKKMTYHARGELLWLQDGQSYDVRLEASALFIGSRIRTSSGKLTDRGLAPTRFSDKTRSELAAHFERDKGQVSFSANRPAVPIVNDMQDQLSVLLQVASMLAGNPSSFPAGTSVSYPVVGPRDADVWTFTVQGDEVSYLPSGQTATVKIIRNPRKEFDQKVEAWLAPTLSYMPVRLKITNPNADFFDMQLRVVDKP